MLDYNKLKAIAMKKNIQLKQLAKAVGVSESGIHYMIRNNTMKMNVLQKIMDILNVTIYELMAGERKKTDVVNEPEAPYIKAKHGIGERIQLIIKDCCGKQSIFAQKTGIDPSRLSKVISQDITPGVDMLEKIYNVFPQYSMKWLITGKGAVIDSSDGSGACLECENLKKMNRHLSDLIEKLNMEIEKCKKKLAQKK